MKKTLKFSYFIKGIILAALSGLLMYLAWPVNSLYPLLFVALVPLLFGLKKIAIESNRFGYLKSFGLIFITYVIWVSSVTYWLYVTSKDTHIALALFTSFNYGVFLAFFPMVYKKAGKNYGLIYFVSAMLLVDWISQTFLLATPYFNLGLGLGKAPWLIQHYRYIGVEGGTLWIVLINVLVFKLVDEKSFSIKKLSPLIGLGVLIPILSFFLYKIPADDNGEATTILLHHSCFNPVTKETSESPEKVLDDLFSASFEGKQDVPSLVVWPETAIVKLGWLHRIEQESVILHLKSKLKKYPTTTLVFGAIGFSYVKNKKDISKYTTYVPEGDYYYNTHNLAISVSAFQPTTIKSKELFIPFHERIPYVDIFPFMTKLVDVVGQKVVFTHYKKGNQYTVANNNDKYVSVLCYESLFPLFMIEKSSNKVGAVIVHANEHWIKDMTGSEQYLYKNICMAVQGGKPLIRTSNCGTSTVIDRKGDTSKRIVGNTNQNQLVKINLNYVPTFYSRIAGYFYWLGLLFVVVILIYSLFHKS